MKPVPPMARIRVLLPPGLPSYPGGRGDVLVLWCLAFSAGQGMYPAIGS